MRQGFGGFAPGNKILLCESFEGSEKATQTEAFEAIGSVNRLSSLENSALSELFGGGIDSSSFETE